MPIHNFIGTGTADIGKLHIFTGTSHDPIGKVYLFDGADFPLIYSAEQVILPSESVLPIETVNNGLDSLTLDSITTDALTIGGWIGISYDNNDTKIIYIVVPLDGETITYTVKKTAGTRNCKIEGGLYSAEGVWTTLSTGVGTFTVDISTYTGTQYIGLKMYGNMTGNQNNEQNTFSLTDVTVK